MYLLIIIANAFFVEAIKLRKLTVNFEGIMNLGIPRTLLAK